MKFIGILTWISAQQSGTSKAGNAWRKVEFVVTEQADRYPNALLISALNDKLDQFAGIKIGDRVEVDYDAKVRDWSDSAGNARKSLDLSLYRIVNLSAVQQPAQQPAAQQVANVGNLQANIHPTQPITFDQPAGDGLPW